MRQEQVMTLLSERRMTTAEIARELKVSLVVVSNALIQIRARRTLHSEPSGPIGGAGRRRLQYWLDGAPEDVKKRLCVRCQKRWAQESGRCRRCSRASGFFASNLEADAALVARMDFSHLVKKEEPRETVYRVIDGQEFEVTFTGKDTLFPNRPGMPSALSGLGCRVLRDITQ